MSQTAVKQPPFQSGQHVRIVDAEPGAPDAKAVVYYDFYRNLTGTVIKAYDDDTVAISVDRKALPDLLRKRHEDAERAQRDRWLNGLSDEDRNRLTEKEKSFSLRYTLLVASKYVVPESGGAPAKSKAQPAQTPKPAAAESAAATAEPDAAATRPTTADLDAAEDAYLKAKRIR